MRPRAGYVQRKRGRDNVASASDDDQGAPSSSKVIKQEEDDVGARERGSKGGKPTSSKAKGREGSKSAQPAKYIYVGRLRTGLWKVR